MKSLRSAGSPCYLPPASILVLVLAAALIAAPAYPVTMSANKRYLVDQNNVPFLINGDSPQALMVNISEADADTFFADRQQYGFNAAWVNLLCATYTGGRADGSTYDGIVPFTTAMDLSAPNEAYFTRCDHMIQSAASHGITVVLDPCETGSFLSVMKQNGVAKCRAYGRYLGNRYKTFDNIVWMSGNDFQDWSDAYSDSVATAVALGIKDNDTRHLHTVELDYVVSGSLDDPNWAAIVGLDASYTYYPTYAQVLLDYNRALGKMPVFLVEANYEFEGNNGIMTTIKVLREQVYWTMLSGATGHLYGNGYTWPFKSGWKTHYDTPGATQVGYAKTFFDARPWWTLVPDQAHTVLTKGYGTFASTGYDLASNDYATASVSADSSLFAAYLPSTRTVTVDVSRLRPQITAQWFDPSNNTYAAIAGSPFANTGTHDFTPPAKNSGGDGDFVLVLESGIASANQVPCVKRGAALCAIEHTAEGLRIVLDKSIVLSGLRNAALFDGRGRMVKNLFPAVLSEPKSSGFLIKHDEMRPGVYVLRAEFTGATVSTRISLDK